MAGRHRTFEEAIVLKKASEVFWAKGYESTTTEDLLKAMHLNKGSLYNAFGNKKSLFQQVVNFHATNLFLDLDQRIKGSVHPIQVIKELFREVCDPEDPAMHEKGCFFGNAVSELASIDKELERMAVEKLRTLESFFEKALEQAKDLNQWSGDTKTTARYLITIWNGVNVTRRMYPRRSDLEPSLRMSLQVLDNK